MLEKTKITELISIGIIGLALSGCGDVITQVEDRPTPPPDPVVDSENKGYYVDENVSGIEYVSQSGCSYVESNTSVESKEVCSNVIEGNTSLSGKFGFIPGGKGVKLSIAGLSLDYISPKYLIEDGVVITVREQDSKLASFLQSMDNDGNASNGIVILPEVVQALQDLNISGQYQYVGNSSLNIETLVGQVQSKLDKTTSPENNNTQTSPISDGEVPIVKQQKSSIATLRYVDEVEALAHLQATIKKYTPVPSTTVKATIEKIKDLADTASTLSVEDIQTKVKEIRTQLDNPLEGDRNHRDIEIAQALVDLSELSNQGYLEDIFTFRNSEEGVNQIAQLIKEMSVDTAQNLVTSKDENSTNLISTSKKLTLGVAQNIKTISNRLGHALASVPQHYKFKYDGLEISLDNLQTLRAFLLTTASQMSLSTAYNVGLDANYKPQTYTDAQGNKYQFEDSSIHQDVMLNNAEFGKTIDQNSLSLAKNYLFETALILKDLDANAISEDLNDSSATTTNVSDKQDVIDYATQLYKVLHDGNGTIKVTNDTGGPNGEKEEIEIALNRLFDLKTAPKTSDFGTNWVYTCEKGLIISTAQEAKRDNEVMCFYTGEGLRYPQHSADLNATTKAQAETSGLDELIPKITLGGSVEKIGQELIDYILEDTSSSSSTPVAKPQFTYENVAGKTYHAIHEKTPGGTEFRFATLGTNTLSGYDITTGGSLFQNASFTITNGHLIVSTFDFELLETNVNGQYEYGKFTRTDNTGDTVRFFYAQNNALDYLGEKRDFSLMGTDRSIISAPNGGEKVQTSPAPTITWNQNKITTSYIRLYVLDDNPLDLYNYKDDVKSLIASKNWGALGLGDIIPNTGSYTVQASELSSRIGNQYVVLIVSEDDTQWDVGDSTFSINQ